MTPEEQVPPPAVPETALPAASDSAPPEPPARKDAPGQRPEGARPKLPPGEARASVETVQTVETLLFASDEPLAPTRIAELAGVESSAALSAIDELNRQYEQTGRTFRIHKVALGFQLYTRPEFAETVRKLYRRQFIQRLSGPALEVLAVVAYKQPVTRPEIEKFRGVDCAGPLVTLLERRLITTAGRAHRPGSPFLYRTTREFLRYFGLESLDALPPMEELTAFLAGQEPEVVESLAEDYDADARARTMEAQATAGADALDAVR